MEFDRATPEQTEVTRSILLYTMPLTRRIMIFTMKKGLSQVKRLRFVAPPKPQEAHYCQISYIQYISSADMFYPLPRYLLIIPIGRSYSFPVILSIHQVQERGPHGMQARGIQNNKQYNTLGRSFRLLFLPHASGPRWGHSKEKRLVILRNK